ncbi:MAG: hypothetical protein LKE43_03460 [Olsenella sp.]|nr:hypothetical protein [Olsenella sp.]
MGSVDYNQAADVALGVTAQSSAAQGAIAGCYIWVETVAFAICGVLLLFFTVEKNLPAEQAALKERNEGTASEAERA